MKTFLILLIVFVVLILPCIWIGRTMLRGAKFGKALGKHIGYTK